MGIVSTNLRDSRLAPSITMAVPEGATVQLLTVKIRKSDDINFILGQSHFIKTVEDIHEAMVQSVPGIKFGLAFCESSGAMLVRWTGTDDPMIELAKRNALALAAGHSFILFLGSGFFPSTSLILSRWCPRSAESFARLPIRRKSLSPKRIREELFWAWSMAQRQRGWKETRTSAWRRDFLRRIGYKL